MFIVTTKSFLLWIEKQLNKGGDYESLILLIDTLGGLSNKELNLLRIKSETKVKLKVNIEKDNNFDISEYVLYWVQHHYLSLHLQH